MVPLEITHEEFIELLSLQRKCRPDWPAAFSTNPRGHIWPWVCYGWTPLESRDYVRGFSTVIDRVAKLYLDERPEGGRFFIDMQGAHWKRLDGELTTFVYFRVVGRRSGMPADSASHQNNRIRTSSSNVRSSQPTSR
jgi:hypothetical protein